MNSEEYDIIPINSKCINNANNLLITNKPGSNISDSTNNIDSVNYQQKVYAQYDNTEEIDVKPMFGGKDREKLNNYKIKFLKKYYNIFAKNEIDAIKKVLKDKIYKIDHLLTINDKQIYIIRGRYKNKFKKI